MLTVEQLLREVLVSAMAPSGIRVKIKFPMLDYWHSDGAIPRNTPANAIPYTRSSIRDAFANQGSYFSPSWQNQRVRRVG